MSMRISKEDGRISFFSRTGNFLLVERGQEMPLLDDFLDHEDVSARVKVSAARRLAADFNWKVVAILPTAFSKTLNTSLS